MKMDLSEVVAASMDLCDPRQNLLIVSDDKYVIINSRKRVAIYSMVNYSFVRDVLETEVVEDIWSASPDDDHFFALCSTSHELSVLKVSAPEGKVLHKLKVNSVIGIPENTIDIKADFALKTEEKATLTRCHFLVKKGTETHLISQDNLSGKKLLFGQNEFYDSNDEIVVMVKKAIKGNSGLKLQVSSTQQGSTLWSKTMEENRPITCIRCPPTKDKFFATGDKSGRVRIWKAEKAYTEGHWHSLPIEALEFTRDAIHILSGGGEGVIIKWEVKSMRKLCLVPRLSTTITSICTSFSKVICCTQLNNLKVFTSNLEDEGAFWGLSGIQKTPLRWHTNTSSLVLIGPSQHQLQFFNPLQKKQKFCLEIISQNVVLGERESKVPQNKIIDFDINGDEIVTLEETWDKDRIVKFWRLISDDKIKYLCKYHDKDLQRVHFVHNEAILAFSEKCAKLWLLQDETEKWGLVKEFRHLDMTPSCAACSEDQTVLAFAFQALVILYDFRTLEPLSYLSSKSIGQDLQSLKFRSRFLFCASRNGLYIWDIIRLKLMGHFQVDNVEIIEKEDKDRLLFKSEKGLMSVDSSLVTSKVLDSKIEAKAKTFAHNDRIYFVDESKGYNTLRFLRTNQDDNDRSTPVVTEEKAFNLMSSFDKLRVTAEENIYHAKHEPLIDPDVITKKVSLCSESIIKRALPV